MTEPRSPFQTVQSPRVGGCVGAFFQFFDWNLSKRFSSTKRIPAADGVGGTFRRSTSVRESQRAGAKMSLEKNGGGPPGEIVGENAEKISISNATSEDVNMKAPGVVARLMGLESLPDGHYLPKHRRSQSYSVESECCPLADYKDEHSQSKLQLQDLLNRDLESSRRHVKGKLSSSVRKPQDLHEQGGTRRGVAPALSRLGQEKIMSPYVDPLPEKLSYNFVRHTLLDKELKKQGFVTRLASSPRQTGPVLLPSKSHNQMTSPLRSPASNLGGFLSLEAAVKIVESSLQPSMRPRTSHGRPPVGHQPLRDTECKKGLSPRGEKGIGRDGDKSSKSSNFVSFDPSNSNACKLLLGRSMSRTWSGREDHESRTGQVDGPQLHRGSVSFRESRTKDCASRDSFEKVLAAEARSVSPPRYGHRRKAASAQRADSQGSSANAGSRTHESAIHQFKTDVKNSVSSVSDISGGSATASTNSRRLDLTPQHQTRFFGVGSDVVETTESPAPVATIPKLPSLTEKFTAAAHIVRNPPPLEPVTGEPDNLASELPLSRKINYVTPEVLAGMTTGKIKLKEGVAKCDGNQVGRRVTSYGQPPSTEVASEGQQPPVGAFRAIKALRSKAKQDKNVTLSGNRVFPTESTIRETHGECVQGADGAASMSKDVTLKKQTSRGIIKYDRLSGRREGDKFPVTKKNDAHAKGEVPVSKRAEITLQSVIRRQCTPPRCTDTSKLVALKQMSKKNAKKVHNSKETSGLISGTVGHREMKQPISQGKVKEGVLTVVPSHGNISGETRAFICNNISGSSEGRCSEATEGLVHGRARSVDDVFPELPLDVGMTELELLEDITKPFEVFNLDGQDSRSLECRSIERMFGKGIVPFIAPLTSTNPDTVFAECAVDVGKPREFPNPAPMSWDEMGVQVMENEDKSGEVSHANLQELIASVSDDLHWEDEMVERRRQIQCRGRYSERREFDHSTVSVCESSDRAESLGDAWSTSSLFGFASETPERIEIGNVHLDGARDDDILMPIFTASFEEKGPAVGLEESGQPSPVSILDSPFHDEACTTPESSLTESLQRLDDAFDDQTSKGAREAKNLLDKHKVELSISTDLTDCTESDKIRQAILDISRFRNIDVLSVGSTNTRLPTGPDEEQKFVHDVLSAAQLLSNTGASPHWFDMELAIDPFLFDRLESGDSDQSNGGKANFTEYLGYEDSLQRSGGLWRCDRKLLFDCVNEAFCFKLGRYKDPQPWVRSPVMSPRPTGQKLVKEVYRKIEEWRQLASNAIDTLIDNDMSIRYGKWKDFSQEVAEVGLDIERMLWKVIIEEVVLDISTTCKRETHYLPKNFDLGTTGGDVHAPFSTCLLRQT